MLGDEEKCKDQNYFVSQRRNFIDCLRLFFNNRICVVMMTTSQVLFTKLNKKIKPYT